MEGNGFQLCLFVSLSIWVFTWPQLIVLFVNQRSYFDPQHWSPDKFNLDLIIQLPPLLRPAGKWIVDIKMMCILVLNVVTVSYKTLGWLLSRTYCSYTICAIKTKLTADSVIHNICAEMLLKISTSQICYNSAVWYSNPCLNSCGKYQWRGQL